MNMELFEEIVASIGDSNEESRRAVKDAHRGMDNLREMALMWAEHHKITATMPIDLIVAYASAVDFGFRIGHKQETK